MTSMGGLGPAFADIGTESAWMKAIINGDWNTCTANLGLLG